MISERPAEVEDRAVLGHWERELIRGLKSSAIGTLTSKLPASPPDGVLVQIDVVVSNCAGTPLKHNRQQRKRRKRSVRFTEYIW